MDLEPELHKVTPEHLGGIEEQIRLRLTGRVRDLHLVVVERGLVVRGCSHIYYAKKVAQHAREAIGVHPPLSAIWGGDDGFAPRVRRQRRDGGHCAGWRPE
jgi:hypothetical protein